MTEPTENDDVPTLAFSKVAAWSQARLQWLPGDAWRLRLPMYLAKPMPERLRVMLAAGLFEARLASRRVVMHNVDPRTHGGAHGLLLLEFDSLSDLEGRPAAQFRRLLDATLDKLAEQIELRVKADREVAAAWMVGVTGSDGVLLDLMGDDD